MECLGVLCGALQCFASQDLLPHLQERGMLRSPNAFGLCEELAKQLNFQYKCGFPVASLLIYIILMSCTSGDLNDVCSYTVRSVVFILMAPWRRKPETAAKAGNIFRIYRASWPWSST